MADLRFGAAADIVRDSIRRFIDGFVESLPYPAPQYGEAKAIRGALRFTASFVDGPIYIESDCKWVVDALLDPSFTPCWAGVNINEEAKSCLNLFDRVSLSFIGRDRNRVAHGLAYNPKLI